LNERTSVCEREKKLKSESKRERGERDGRINKML
jgi:hypothetical protein